MHEDGRVSIESYEDFNTCARYPYFGDTRCVRETGCDCSRHFWVFQTARGLGGDLLILVPSE